MTGDHPRSRPRRGHGARPHPAVRAGRRRPHDRLERHGPDRRPARPRGRAGAPAHDWLVLDESPSMHFGTADRRKADVAEGAALVVGRLAARRGNRLGVVTFGGPRRAVPPADRRPPRHARAAAAPSAADPAEEGGGQTSPAAAPCDSSPRSRTASSLAVVVSDFRGPRDWRAALTEVVRPPRGRRARGRRSPRGRARRRRRADAHRPRDRAGRCASTPATGAFASSSARAAAGERASARAGLPRASASAISALHRRSVAARAFVRGLARTTQDDST